MSDDDVRRALSTYAATTPDLDPRAGLAGRMARRQRARQTAIAGTAVLAAAIAGTGVATLDRGDKSTVGVLAVDTPSATPTRDEPTPTTSPSSIPTSHPTQTWSPPPPSGNPTATTAPPASPTPTDPGPVTASAGGEKGLRVVATLSTGGPATATSVTLTVEAEDDDGQPATPVIDWGEGEPKGGVSTGASCVGDGKDEPDPGSLRKSFTHAWRNPGTYTVVVTVVSFDYCDDAVEQERQTVRLPIEVRPGKVVSNGPAAPYADHVGHLYGDDEGYRTVTLEWTLRDQDGYVGSVLVDWGDGSEPERFRNDPECDDGKGARYPNTRFGDAASHEYELGEHTVTLTFSSTGCDGEDRQWATKTHKVFVESVD